MSSFISEAKNQHFISQAELRLNALNPQAQKENQRIYVFKVTDREAFGIQLESPRGRKISGTLSFTDLFSFDVVDNSWRLNLETAFQRFENQVRDLSEQLMALSKSGETAQMQPLLRNIFVTKFVSSLRNPFAVRKAIGTIGSAARFKPRDKHLQKVFNRIRVGSKPHEVTICVRFGISPDLYRQWLEALFMVLTINGQDGRSLLEQAMDDLFDSSFAFCRLNRYISVPASAVALVSDRGFSTRANQAATFEIEFNIASRLFAQYVFADPAKWLPPAAKPEALHDHLRKSDLEAKLIVDDLDELRSFNRLAVYQSAERVFAASPTPHL